MKLHKNIKRKENMRRALGVVLALSMAVSAGASPMAAGAPAAGAHQHEEGCYGRVYVGEMGEHGGACYKTLPICGYGDDAGIAQISVSGGDADLGGIPSGGEGQDGNASGNPGDENASNENEGVKEDEGAGSGTGEEPGEGPEESGEGSSADVGPEGSGDSAENRGSVSGGDAADSLPFEGYDDSHWAVDCRSEEAGHMHSRECYREIHCGVKAHIHGAECADEKGEYVCEMEEHIHDALCFATPEKIELLDRVSGLIASLPTEEEIRAVMEQYEAGEMDEDQYGNYLLALMTQVKEAYDAYLALDGELCQYVTNGEYLLQLAELLDVRTLEEGAGSIWGELDGDDAYVDKITITEILDGTAPFDHRKHIADCYNAGGELICSRTEYGDDEADRPGDDTSPGNLVVRTFDSVNYKFSVDMKTYASNKGYKYARVKLEFVLPVSREQAEFDLAAMSWMDTSEGYGPVVTEEVRKFKDGDEEKEVVCQVLTCYKHLMPAEGGKSVVPGSFGDNVTINVKSMANGDTFAPIVSAAMEHSFWGDTGVWTEGPENGGACFTGGCWGQEPQCPVEGHGTEKKSVRAKEVTVSAAPKYNIQIRGAGSYTAMFDFSDGAEYAANKETGQMYGRAMKLGVVLQLYNDNRSKGLKGIELPDTTMPIEFDLEVGSRYGNNGKYDTTTDYRPLLWSYGSSGAANYMDPINGGDGRIILETNRTAGLAPNGDGGAEIGCDNSGTWKVTQEGNKIHVTVSGYTVNVDNMPRRNGDYGEVLYGSDIGIGCFASGQIWILQPFNRVGEGSGNEGPDFGIIKEPVRDENGEPVKDGQGNPLTYGEGAFSTSADAMNLKIWTVGGSLYEDDNGTNSSQMVKNDDHYAGTLALTLQGSLQNRVRYADLNDPIKKGAGIYDVRDGRDYATVGSKIRVMGGFSYHTNREPDNQFYFATTLTKFYAEAMTPIDGEEDSIVIDKSGVNNQERVKVKAYYAAKKEPTVLNGEKCWDWVSDEELQTTYEDKLDFYESMEALGKDGKVCVGILYCFIGPGATVEEEESDFPQYVAFHKMEVTDDMNLAGQTYMLLSTTRIWTKGMFERDDRWKDRVTGKDEKSIAEIFENVIPQWSSAGKTADFPNGYLSSANFGNADDPKAGYPGEHYWYVKEEYAPDGSGILGKHNSDWSHWGDTLLLIGYKTEITKHLLQKVGNADKKVFNLDTKQRVVDFKLQPYVKYDNQEGLGDNEKVRITVQVVDILPEYLTYVEGSAYYGFDGSSFSAPPEGGNEGTVMHYVQTVPIGGKQGTVEGGLQMEPKIGSIQEKQKDGTYVERTTLTWELKDIIVGEDVPAIFYSAVIGNEGNAKEDVPAGTTPLENKVYISSEYDLRDPSVENHKLAKEGITVTRGSASSFGKYTLQRVAERDGQIDYVVYYNNNAETPAWVSFMDTMPFDGIAGSAFKGSYELKEWKLDLGTCEKEKVVIYYTTKDEYRDQTIQNLMPEAKDGDQIVQSLTADAGDGSNPWKQIGLSPDGTIETPADIPGWTKADIAADGTISFSEGEKKAPVAWLVFGQLEGGQSINIELKIQLHPSDLEEGQDIYVNRMSTGDDIVTTETPTVKRTLEGLTWLDYNRDGIQDQFDGKEEPKTDGIRVELLKLKAGGDPQKEEDYVVARYIASDTEDADEAASESLGYRAGAGEAVIVTGQLVNLRDGKAVDHPEGEGRYKFIELPPGTYGVRFSGGDEGDADRSEYAKAFHAWKATLKDVWGNANDETDSDAEPVYGEEGARLEKTVILGIVMKEAEVMYEENLRLQEEKHYDSGFYVESTLDLEKVDDEDTGKLLAGAQFTISAWDSSSNTVRGTLSFTGTSGAYSFLQETGVYGEGAKYYMEFAGNSDFVLGVSHGGDGGVAQLQHKRSGFEGQLFEIFPQANGTFAFRYAGSQRWLDLDGGNTEDNHKVHIWSNETPNANQMWRITQDREGNMYVQANAAKGTDKGYLDLMGCSVAEGTQIAIYTKNGTAAQKWRLVPYEGMGQAQTLEVGAEGDRTGKLCVKNLVPGEYLITEMRAPLGYSLLKEPVKIKVGLDGRISVMNTEDGYDPAEEDVLVRITNKIYQLYSLPSTGGAGIGGYGAMGIVLMAAAMAYFLLGGKGSVRAGGKKIRHQ